MGIQNYIKDIKKAHRKLKGYDQFVPFFRYPFLDYGKTLESRNTIELALQALHYKNGYVTIDNADWYMDFLIQGAVKEGKKVNIERLKKLYIEVLWDSILFYDQLSQNLIQRSPKHVLLLHENDLAALFIKDLIEHIRSQGWSIISPLQAYEDPIAKHQPDTLINNNGRIAAIAHATQYTGVKYDRFQSTETLDKYFLEQKIYE